MKHHQKPPKHDQQQTRIRQLSNENKQLAKEVKKLHKQMQKVKDGWCPTCLSKSTEDKMPKKIANLDKVKDWQCFKCENGTLRLFKYDRMSQTWYFRRCSSCEYRTRGKPWSDEVKE